MGFELKEWAKAHRCWLHFAESIFLILFTSLCLPAIAFSQDSDFSSEEARKLYNNMPKEVYNIINGRAPAPTASPEVLARLRRDMFLEMVKDFQIEEKSPEWEYHKARIIDRNNDKIDIPTQPGTQAPIEHHRFKGGSTFPSADEIEREKSNKLSAKTPAPYRPRKRIFRATKDRSKDNTEIPVVTKPLCSSSHTSKLPIPDNYLVAGQPADILFTNSTPPFNVPVAIGQNTYVIVFGEKDQAYEASLYMHLPISCVPFRIRSTGKQVTYSQGTDALKNYDANPEANGTLDPTVKKYIEQTGLK